MNPLSGPSPSDLATILCVDDDPDVLRVMVHALSREFQVVTAGDGAEALKQLDRSGPFAVVVADLNMPGMSGSTFLAEVRERAPETVRVMVTGCTHVVGAPQVTTDGTIFRFITKPFLPPELLEAVREGVRQHRILRDETRRDRKAA